MNKSESINELAAALSKAQGEFKAAPFDRVNPHFRNKYATLTSIMQTIQAPLAKHGLSVVQTLETREDKMFIVTTVLHASGQWLADCGIPLMLDKTNMQGLGSACTYAKRYGLSAMLGVISDEDDDGNAVSAAPEITSVSVAQAPKPTPAATTAPMTRVLCDKCNKPMMVSKMNTDQLYCVSCKTSKPKQS